MQIEISDDVYDYLLHWGKPLESADHVLRRRLKGFKSPSGLGTPNGCREKTSDPGGVIRKRLKKGLATPRRTFRPCIAEVLILHQNEASSKQIEEGVYRLLGKKLNSYDRQKVPTGQVRWIKGLHWEMRLMKSEGILVNPRRGLWKLNRDDSEGR